MVDRHERRKGVGITEARVWPVSQAKNLKGVKINSSDTVEANRNDGYLVTLHSTFHETPFFFSQFSCSSAGQYINSVSEKL